MLSVTQRIKMVQQPKFGYLPIKNFKKITMFFDDEKIQPIESAYKPLQGLVVDYLTRFMIGSSKKSAFQISLMGAERVNEQKKALNLLKKINGVDPGSICAAYKLVRYDVAYRRGAKYFSKIALPRPNQKMIKNAVTLINRSVKFLKDNGQILLDGFTFKGAYNDIISKGDGDYLTSDTLWDFKVSNSKPTSNYTLQILVYYILGIHSVHPEFQKTKKLGIFNPELNTAYIIDLSSISDETFQAVSRDVIGYRTPEDATLWRCAAGTDKAILQKLCERLFLPLRSPSFSPENFDDGIHDVPLDDYRSYCSRFAKLDSNFFFPYTDSIKLLKNSTFFMFVSINKNGETCILDGAALKKIKKPLTYYYEHLAEYATAVLQKFSKYWQALYAISDQLQSITYNEEELKGFYNQHQASCAEHKVAPLPFDNFCNTNKRCFSGKVHGCIIDIDDFNHIYLNPYDGTLSAYYAESMCLKCFYKNVPSLIAAHTPKSLPAFNRNIEKEVTEQSTALTVTNSQIEKLPSIFKSCEISDDYTLVTDRSMYEISRKMKALQKIYDRHLVTAWYDEILPQYELE